MRLTVKTRLTSFVSVFCIAAAMTLSVSPGYSQRNGNFPPPPGQMPGGEGGPQGQAQKKKGPESLEKFLKKDAKIMKGFTTVYNQDDKWYISINDSIIGRDIELVSRISKSAEGGRRGFNGYAGDIVAGAFGETYHSLANNVAGIAVEASSASLGALRYT